MVYVAELDDLRQQVRYGYAGNTLRFFPKVNGVGNVLVQGTPTYEVHRPGDSVNSVPLQIGTAAVDNTSGVSVLSANVDASDTTRWQLNIGEHWILWTWGYAGVVFTYQMGFDVVRDPWVPSISLDDIIEEVSDMGRRATAQASRLSTGRTPEAHASVLAMKAWGDVWEWLRQKAEGDDDGFLPSLILDKESLRRVVVAQTVSRIYRAEGGSKDSEARALADEWALEAKTRFQSMGPLRYSAADDRAPVAVIKGWSVARVTRGSW